MTKKSLGLGVRPGTVPQGVRAEEGPSGPPGKPRKTVFREYGLRPSRDLQRFCRDAGGLNDFGGPMYRLAWAPSRLVWMAGKWRINDEHGNFMFWHIDSGYAPKYPQLGERFILEVWKPAYFYGSPASWEDTNRQHEENGEVLGKLGPYPHLGDYELVFHFQTEDTKEFVIQTPTLCELRIQEHLRIARRRALLDAMAKDARDYEEKTKRREQADILAEPFDGLNGLITPYVSLSGLDVPPATPPASSTTTEVS